MYDCRTQHSHLFTHKQVQDFISLVSGSDSLYGFCPDTLNSLVLTLLPSVDHVYEELGELSLVDDSKDVKFYILQEIVLALRECSGFFISKVKLACTCGLISHWIMNLFV